MTRKSYSAISAFTSNDANGYEEAHAIGDIFYAEEIEGDALVAVGLASATTDYLSIADAQTLTGSGGDVTETKTLYSVSDGTTIAVTVAIPSASTTLAAAGTVLTMTIKDSDGNTIETRSHTFAQIAKGGDETATFITPSGLIDGSDVDFSIVMIDDGNDYTYSVDAELSVPVDVAGVIFSVGASVAATNPIVTGLQFIDSDGEDIADRVVCEIFPFADFDSLQTLSACTAGSDGSNIGTFGSNSSFMAISEVDGDLDVTMTKGTAGRARVGCRLPDGKLFVSDEAIWTA